ncbi:MAG: glycosyltransferase [Imperialibacter sp.]
MYDAKKKDHTNKVESLALAEVFDMLGYNVDVIQYTSDRRIDYETYDIIFGLGKPLENYFLYHQRGHCKVIWYGMGCYPYFTSQQSISRLIEFHSRHGLWLTESIRVDPLPYYLQIALADLIIVKGSSFTKSTYELRSASKIELIETSVFLLDGCNLGEKDFSSAKTRYLWFGSSGALHKGLDLLIEAFERNKDLELHICGLSKHEKEFRRFYSKSFSKGNIHDHGFIDIESESFRHLLETCSFVIVPSVAEGNCASVVTVAANGGLIPVVTQAAGIDMTHAIEISEVTEAGIENSIKRSQELSLQEISRRAKLIHDSFREKHSITNYKSIIFEKLSNFFLPTVE